jgi:hypothetical protein
MSCARGIEYHGPSGHFSGLTLSEAAEFAARDYPSAPVTRRTAYVFAVTVELDGDQELVLLEAARDRLGAISGVSKVTSTGTWTWSV